MNSELFRLTVVHFTVWMFEIFNVKVTMYLVLLVFFKVSLYLNKQTYLWSLLYHPIKLWKIYWLYNNIIMTFHEKNNNRHLKTYIRKEILISIGTHHIIHFLLNTRHRTSHLKGALVPSYFFAHSSFSFLSRTTSSR